MTQIPLIQSLYEAFAKGDAASFLSKMSDDVSWEQWENNSAQQRAVPYLQPRRGKAGVRIEFDVKATGKRVRDEEIHLWTLDAQGRVLALRHYVDTAKHIAANTP